MQRWRQQNEVIGSSDSDGVVLKIGEYIKTAELCPCKQRFLGRVVDVAEGQAMAKDNSNWAACRQSFCSKKEAAICF